jgi:hypothetical protein
MKRREGERERESENERQKEIEKRKISTRDSDDSLKCHIRPLPMSYVIENVCVNEGERERKKNIGRDT